MMKWEEVLKDIVSHTALTTGVEPKGTMEINEARIVEIIDNHLSEFKRNLTPIHNYKDTLNAYMKSLKPDVKELKQSNPEITTEEAVKKVHTTTRFFKFVIKYQTTDKYKRLWRKNDGPTN